MNHLRKSDSVQPRMSGLQPLVTAEPEIYVVITLRVMTGAIGGRK